MRARRATGSPDGDGAVEQGFAKRIQQEAGTAGNGRADHAADQMTKHAGADARVEEDGEDAAFDLRRIEARDGAFARAGADGGGVFKIIEMADAVAGMVALHIRAAARKHAGPGGVAGACIGTCEAVTGGKGDLAAAIGCAAAFAVGDAGDGAGGFLDDKGAFAQQGGFGIARVG
jgi:hypothetical protein